MNKRHIPVTAVTVALACAVAATILSLFAIAINGDDQLYRSQIEACQRGNKLRAHINQRIDAPPIPLIDCQAVIRQP